MTQERDVTGDILSGSMGHEIGAVEGCHFEVTFAPENAGRRIKIDWNGDGEMLINKRRAIRVVLVEDEKP